MAIGLGTLEYVLEEGSPWKWFDDATIRDCALIAGVAGALFVIRSFTFPRPAMASEAPIRISGPRGSGTFCRANPW